MRIVTRAVVWALVGSILGALTWSALGATIFQLIPPYGPPSSAAAFVVAIPRAFLAIAYFAVFIAALAVPVYTVLFAVWLAVLRVRPDLSRTPGRRAIATLAFALPPAALLAYGFAHTSGFPFDWAESARIFPLALISAWCGVAGSAPLAEKLGGERLDRAA